MPIPDVTNTATAHKKNRRRKSAKTVNTASNREAESGGLSSCWCAASSIGANYNS
jgi:hypothetical protein